MNEAGLYTGEPRREWVVEVFDVRDQLIDDHRALASDPVDGRGRPTAEQVAKRLASGTQRRDRGSLVVRRSPAAAGSTSWSASDPALSASRTASAGNLTAWDQHGVRLWQRK